MADERSRSEDGSRERGLLPISREDQRSAVSLGGLVTTVVYPRALNPGVWARWDWDAQQQGSEPERGPSLVSCFVTLSSLAWGGQALL